MAGQQSGPGENPGGGGGGTSGYSGASGASGFSGTSGATGGGGTPAGSNGDLQKKNGSSLAASSINDAAGSAVQTSASASALVTGPNGAINPVLKVDNSTASQADGVSITGGALGDGTTFQALSSGSNSPLSLKGKGSGRINVYGGSIGRFVTFEDGIVGSGDKTTYGAAEFPTFRVYNGAMVKGSWSSNIFGAIPTFLISSDSEINWASGTDIGGGVQDGDLRLRRRAAANLQMGTADAASPVAQTLSVQNVVAGTSNTAGVNFTIAGSQGTGTGAGGSIVFQTAPAGSTGTAQNALAAALTLGSDGSLAVQKTITAGGTTGAQTINKPAGTVNFAASATSLVVTNSLVTANSIIIATVGTNDTTMKSVQAVAGSGSFTLYANAAATAETRVNFLVIN